MRMHQNNELARKDQSHLTAVSRICLQVEEGILQVCRQEPAANIGDDGDHKQITTGLLCKSQLAYATLTASKEMEPDADSNRKEQAKEAHAT